MKYKDKIEFREAAKVCLESRKKVIKAGNKALEAMENQMMKDCPWKRSRMDYFMLGLMLFLPTFMSISVIVTIVLDLIY